MKRAVVAALIMFASGTVGCQEFVDGSQSASYTKALMNVKIGMSRDEVVALMGQPQKRETYGKTEFLIYQTNEAGNFTPIGIVDGKVVGWGRNYYDNAAYSNVKADVVRSR